VVCWRGCLVSRLCVKTTRADALPRIPNYGCRAHQFAECATAAHGATTTTWQLGTIERISGLRRLSPFVCGRRRRRHPQLPHRVGRQQRRRRLWAPGRLAQDVADAAAVRPPLRLLFFGHIVCACRATGGTNGQQATTMKCSRVSATPLCQRRNIPSAGNAAARVLPRGDGACGTDTRGVTPRVQPLCREAGNVQKVRPPIGT